MIELREIEKDFGETKALNNISFKIDTGDIVGLLGPNGAGKSTTMKIISGFLVPDKGEVIIEDEDISINPIKAKEKIGYMPENNPLYKDMIVKDAIDYAFKLHNLPQSDYKKQINYVVQAAGLKEVYYKPISELSKGYKQRVGLAQVLVHNPQILILDEPTEGLDPNQRNEIRNLIRDIGKDRTVIISTHVMQEVEAMCSKIIIINKGEIIKSGTKDEITKGEFKDSVIDIKLKTTSKFELSELQFGKKNKVQKVSSKGNMYEFKITTNDEDSFFTSFSNLLRKNDWTVYKLEAERQNLEDLFRKLTNVSS